MSEIDATARLYSAIERITDASARAVDATTMWVNKIAGGLEELSGNANLATMHAIDDVASVYVMLDARRGAQVPTTDGQTVHCVVSGLRAEYRATDGRVGLVVSGTVPAGETEHFWLTPQQFRDTPTLHDPGVFTAALRGIEDLAGRVVMRAETLEAIAANR